MEKVNKIQQLNIPIKEFYKFIPTSKTFNFISWNKLKKEEENGNTKKRLFTRL